MPISLKTVTLYNFKSFRGEIIIGPIEPFTAIIGPNGSGKSNIMDAICFVLGEKSSALRVKNLSQLIYGASIGNPISHSAHVTAIFVLNDDNEKSFTRMIQGQSSQYKIDNEIVTCDSYMTELKELGLDIKSGNFLISQGYIECIATKSPKERTVMLEQISGSIVYKADYDRLKLELTKIEDEVRFTYQMKKQLLIEKKYTLAEKTEAERYVNLQKKYIRKKSKFQLIQLLFIKRNVEVLQDEQEKNKAKGDDYLRDKNTAMSLLQSKQSQLEPLSNSLEVIEQSIVEQENIIQEKKVEAVTLKENILYWQKKYDFAITSLNTTNKTRDANKKVIQELKDDLEQITNKLLHLQEMSQESIAEFSDSQVEKYMKLKNMTEHQAKDFIKQINRLMREQQIDHDKLDDESRLKQESEDKAKQKALMKQGLEERLRKLQDLSVESKLILTDKIAIKEKLVRQLTETKEKLPYLENNIAKISEGLREAVIDNHTILHQAKQTDTIQLLKQSFSGVHGRLSSMCKPIHSRYDIAVTKVFGKYMNAIVVDTKHTATQCIQFLKQQQIGIETFLPLDSLMFEPLNEKLRSIKEVKGIKLLYDVLDIRSTQINNAVLFVTKNTLVCETSEDARIVAYELSRNTNYNCVSLDGCFYRKDGTFSGGHTDLIVKAKQWKKEQISALKDQKMQLIQEYKNLPKILLIQSELNITDIQINGCTAKERYIQKDIRDVEDNLDKITKELTIYDYGEICKRILKIQQDMKKRDEKIKDLETHVNEIKDEIFSKFCEDMNIPDISYYEKNSLRIYQEQEKKRIELKTQCDRIEKQLDFESKRNTGSKIAKWEHVVQTANKNLNQAHQQEHLSNIAIEQKELELVELQNSHKTIKADVTRLQKEIGQCRLTINIISKSYLQYQKEYITLQKKIEQKKAECSTILKDCKIEDITIPILLEKQDRQDREILSASMNLSCLSEILSDSKIFLSIDFTQFPEDIRNATEETLKDTAKQLDKKLADIQSELESICPNLKAHQKIDSVTQEIRDINAKFQQLREVSYKIKKQFELIKGKRCKLFSDCLECINAKIDVIYQNLVNDESAQAFILPDDPEEPYAGGINYNCIAPFKCFQPLEHLSGGEKSLAGLALLFATHRYKPVPFFIMDEGDAALDNTNIKNIIRFIHSQADVMQFITITLDNSLYSYADALVGVINTLDAKSPESALFAISLNGYKQTTK